MRIIGIAYKLENCDAEDFTITCTYVVSTSAAAGWVRTPVTWKFSYPRVDGFPMRRFGASETFGLFGGVTDELHLRHSEAAERAIGDVLTATICEFMDSNQHDEKSVVLILGPALPKFVGRIASLRLPETVTVGFICPVPFPKWIAEGASEMSMLPHYVRSPSELWEDEPLIRGWEHLVPRKKLQLIVQQIWLGSTTDEVTLPGYAWGSNTLEGKQLPREIVAVIDQVDVHLQNPYKEQSEEPLRSSQSVPEYVAASKQFRDFGPPGWSISWSTTPDRTARPRKT